MVHILIFFVCSTVLSRDLQARDEGLAPQRPQAAPWFAHKKAENFNDLRDIVTDLIGRAESRVIIYTEFLTDGEISSALFLAQYRKIQTVAFLGENSMNRYLSRLGYLKAQNIPVFVRPSQSQFREPTLLLVDRHLYRINRDLDVLKPNLGADIQLASPAWVGRFEKELITALKTNKQAIPKPLPLVGRPGSRPVAGQNMQVDYHGEADGSYNYDRATSGRRSAPAGVPTQLPKTTVFEQRQRQNEAKIRTPKTAPEPAGNKEPARLEEAEGQGSKPQVTGQSLKDYGPLPGFDRTTEDASSSSEEGFDVD